MCQSALNIDPRPASKLTPQVSACAGSPWGDPRAAERPLRLTQRRAGFLWTHRCKTRWQGDAGVEARFLKRQLSLPVSTISQVMEWTVEQCGGHFWDRRRQLGHSPNARLSTVTITESALVEAADGAGATAAPRRPGRRADSRVRRARRSPDEVEIIVGKPSLATRSPFGLEPIDQVDEDGEEPPARSGSDTGARDGDGQVCFARARAADQDEVALAGR